MKRYYKAEVESFDLTTIRGSLLKIFRRASWSYNYRDLKGGFPFSFFCRARDFFHLSSELPCGMKWKTIQFKQ